MFTRKGVQRASLQDIADRLGITKPALHYHFSSREDLVRSIVAPLIGEGERFIAERESARDATARECSRDTSTTTTGTAVIWCWWLRS